MTPPPRTIRVLHLLGEAPDYQTERAASALRRLAGEGFDVTTRTIGRGGDYRHPPAAVARLRRGAAPFDVVHAWDAPSLGAAALAGAGPILFSPMQFLGRRGVAWLRAVMACRGVQVVCPTSTQRRACVGQGVPPDRCHLVRPGVDFSRVRKRRDPSLRAALGLSDSDVVLLLPGESTRPAAHDRAVWAASILGALDRKWKVLMWGRGPQAESAARLGDRVGQPALVCVAERRLGRAVAFEELLPASDIALVSADGPAATLPVATCMAAGLPIVAAVTYTTAELLEDRHTSLMCPPGKPRLLARRVLDLEEDPALRWSIADVARTEAYEFFSQSRFLAQYRSVYRQMAEGAARAGGAPGGKVEVPEPAAGAGTRFHGRG